MSKCRFDSWGENDCDPSEAAGVVCNSPEVKIPKIMPLTQQPAKTKKIQKNKIKVSVFVNRLSNCRLKVL